MLPAIHLHSSGTLHYCDFRIGEIDYTFHKNGIFAGTMKLTLDSFKNDLKANYKRKMSGHNI